MNLSLLLKEDRTLLMGIVNCTPDSFSDGGLYYDQEKAIVHAQQLLEEGADILDIGGESTRPGSDPVPLEEEIRRVVPVIKEIHRRYPDVFISIDTMKAPVAEEALKAGASMINDVTGMTHPPMRAVAQKYRVPVVVMHMKGTPKTMQINPHYDNVIEEVKQFFLQQIKLLKNEGINEIILDPGIGFGKRLEDNLTLLRHLKEFTALGYPLLVGASRKSFLGMVTGLPVHEREEATIAANVVAVMNGAKILRVHNVRMNKRAIQVADALLTKKKSKE